VLRQNLATWTTTKNANVKVVGATPNFAMVQHFETDRGRVFTSSEDIRAGNASSFWAQRR
jgi:hypothetical protein